MRQTTPPSTETIGSDVTFNSDFLSLRASSRYKNENESGWHYHNCTSLVLLLEGACTEKRRNGTFERTAADLTFLHTGEMHNILFGGAPTRYLSLEVDLNTVPGRRVDESLFSNTITKSPDAKFLVLQMYREILFNDLHTTESLHMLFLQFVSSARSIQRRSTHPAWVKTVYELLNDNWDSTVTLQELAHAARVNPTTISKYFPSYFACSLGSYMRKLKVGRSLSMIKKEATSLTDVAYRCNFSDQSHFTRTFKEFTSLSPKQYRQL